jgi:hypothetical protein
MVERVRTIPQERFVEAWNSASSMSEAVERMKELAGGNVPRWAVMAQASALRKAGIEMRPLSIDAKGNV